jgi:hypothetical protein
MRREAHPEFLRSTRVYLDCFEFSIWKGSTPLYRSYKPRFRMQKLVMSINLAIWAFNYHIECFPELKHVELQYYDMFYGDGFGNSLYND